MRAKAGIELHANTKKQKMEISIMKKTHVIMFSPEFVPMIQSGRKKTTIRGTRKRKINVGDIYHFGNDVK